MILKEAFSMQNYLAKMESEAQDFLRSSRNVTTVTENHLRSKANPAAADETKTAARPVEYDPNKVISIYLDLIDEREKLAKAISKAKASADIDMDAAIMINKDKQAALSRMRALDEIKASESESVGRDFLINNEGNQMPYNYTVKSVVTIDFDRNVVKGIIKRLVRETDEVSAKIDLLNVTLPVDYEPKYDIDSCFDDIYESYPS